MFLNWLSFSTAAARQTRDADQNRRREELQRRIEETRQKLQNVSISSSNQPVNISPLFIFLQHCHLFLFLLLYRSLTVKDIIVEIQIDIKKKDDYETRPNMTLE